MNTLAIPAKRFWRTLFFINFGLTLVLLFPFFFILIQRRAWFPYVHTLKKLWARMILFNVGITYEIDCRFQPEKGEKYIFCPNHTSYLDVILCYLSVPVYFHFIAKVELSHAPLFGIFFKKGMDISVDRKSIRSAQKAFNRAAADLRQGISIAMFPEGTISPIAPEMTRFKNGPFKLAIEQQAHIVPITFLNNYTILPDGDRSQEGFPGKAKVVVHEAISTTGLSLDDIEALKEKTYKIIYKELKHGDHT